MRTQVLYESGRFFVTRANFGRSLGFVVYRNDATAATLVARIGYPGDKGLARAKDEADKRAAAEVQPCR